MSKIHYVTNTRCLHEFVSHRDAPEALSRSLVFLTNGSDGPFATKQRLIYAVIKGPPVGPPFSSFVGICVLQPVFLGLHNGSFLSTPTIPAVFSSLHLFLFLFLPTLLFLSSPSSSRSSFLFLSSFCPASLPAPRNTTYLHPCATQACSGSRVAFLRSNTRREIGDTCPSCSPDYPHQSSVGILMNTITGWRLYERRADRKFQIPQLYGRARKRPGETARRRSRWSRP